MTVTNVAVQAKDGAGTAFVLDMGSDSVTGDRVQKVVIAEPAGGTFISPAQDGTDATGVTPPAGATGIRGWLSAIYNKLAGSLAVTGTFWQATQPVSAASLPLPSGAATSVNQPTAATQGSTTSGQTGCLVQGAVTTGSPSYTTAQTSPLSLDTAGNLRVNVVAGSTFGNVAQGSTTSGALGVMIQGAVTAAAPSYTTAKTNPISLNTTGGLRIDGSGVTQPVSAASLPLPTGAAQDGTDASGVLPPAGAAGIRGWLSGIYNKLTGSLAVTGTFWQPTQPVSAASLPLPTGAATAANQIAALPAGTNAIGSIIGRTTMVTMTPAVTSNGAYAAGNVIGGLMMFPIGGAGSGTLMSVRVTSKSILTTALQVYIFSTNPANSTWIDKSVPAINAADVASLLCVIPLNAPFSGLSTHTLWNIGGIGTQFVAANLYVVLVSVSASTLTSASTSDITVQLGISDD